MRQREIDGILIFEVEGRLVMDAGLSSFQETLEAEMDSGKAKQILNLKQVSAIDSSALGTLVLLHTNIARAGGALKLLHLSQRHLELLVLTKLTGVFEIFDDEQQAINSFYPEREVRRFDILEFVKSQESGQQTVGEVANDER